MPTCQSCTCITSGNGDMVCIGSYVPNKYIENDIGCTIYKIHAPTASSIGSWSYSNLQFIDAPQVIGISSSTFSGTNISKADFPSATYIDAYAFSYCDNLTEVHIPKATYLSDYAFTGCSSMTTIDLPSVTIINRYAFSSCSQLNAVILRSNTVCALSAANAFYYTPIHYNTGVLGYIYVPKSLISSYKSATNWSIYANRLRAIEDYPEICGGSLNASEEWVFELEDGSIVTKQVVVK